MLEKEEFALRLKAIRDKKNLSMVRLSELSGVSADTIKRLERGVQNATAITISKLSKALECDTEYFYDKNYTE